MKVPILCSYIEISYISQFSTICFPSQNFGKKTFDNSASVKHLASCKQKCIASWQTLFVIKYWPLYTNLNIYDTHKYKQRCTVRECQGASYYERDLKICLNQRKTIKAQLNDFKTRRLMFALIIFSLWWDVLKCLDSVIYELVRTVRSLFVFAAFFDRSDISKFLKRFTNWF